MKSFSLLPRREDLLSCWQHDHHLPIQFEYKLLLTDLHGLLELCMLAKSSLFERVPGHIPWCIKAIDPTRKIRTNIISKLLPLINPIINAVYLYDEAFV